MKAVIIVLLSLLVFSCKKPEDRECFKVAGNQTSIEIPLDQFHRLHVGAKMQVNLIQSTQNKLIIHGRDNLIHLIDHEIDQEGLLTLTNKNRCDFLRKYAKNDIVVDVYFVNLHALLFEGTKDLNTATPIVTSDFNLTIQDGGATVYLKVDCANLNIKQGHGYGDFVVSGSAINANIRTTSNGFGDAKNLHVSNELIFINSTPVSSSVNVDGAKATIEINGSGNVSYIGVPQSLTITRYGTGEVINAN